MFLLLRAEVLIEPDKHDHDDMMIIIYEDCSALNCLWNLVIIIMTITHMTMKIIGFVKFGKFTEHSYKKNGQMIKLSGKPAKEIEGPPI